MSDTTGGPRIFEVPVDWVLPKLGKRVVPADGRVETISSDDTVAIHDTATGDLADLGVTLVRGSGPDASWTLSVDGTTAQFPVAGRGIPAEIRELLLGVRAGAALRVTGRAEHDRVVLRVLDAEGTELGTIADVRTRAAQAGGDTATLSEQRRVEVSGWDGPFLDAAVRRLEKSGAQQRPTPGRADTDTVGAALQQFLREQRAAVLLSDLGLRRGEDTVHAFRVAIRRIRSALRVVGVAEVERIDALDAELRWLSGLLGAVRDTQVLRAHLRVSIDTLVDTSGVDVAATDALVQAALDDAEASARAALTSALSGRRYLAVLKDLREWTTTPPFTEDAEAPHKELSAYVRTAAKVLERKLAKAGGSADKLHSARKAAKRARYVASFAGTSAGKHGAGVVEHAKSLQTALGDHQDCVMAADFLAHLARTASGSVGPATFGCGVVWVQEQERADEALRRARKARNA